MEKKNHELKKEDNTGLLKIHGLKDIPIYCDYLIKWKLQVILLQFACKDDTNVQYCKVLQPVTKRKTTTTTKRIIHLKWISSTS